ncbi:hypothetical protein SO802_028030 [Lithocarpus litseifolius]|uniref:DUF4283 domain-containing protein n=1 Tax=Lithocarpus litseifolius TaxID=425828 RepID=A0AAW2BR59_9ROSI
MIMEQYLIDGLKHMRLTKEEEVQISVSEEDREQVFEECSLSLFRKLLMDRKQNPHALKNTLRGPWKVGSDLKIIEVGNSILQFKFANEFQIQWVDTNGPWNFKNNLLLLKRWERGMTANNIKFSHSPFWVQIWGLPFDMMTEKLGRDIGSSLGVFITADIRSWSADQAKFMRIRVNIPIDKPLRRCETVVSPEGEATHYGDWLRAQGGSKGGGPKDSLYKTPVSVFVRNYNGEVQKEGTPEGIETGDNAAVSGGENLGENHKGEKVHLVGVSEKGDNNMQRTGDGRIQLRLDRVFATSKWRQRYSQARVIHVVDLTSDHSALILTDQQSPRRHKQKRFHFEVVWTRHEKCQEIVQETWRNQMGINSQTDLIGGLKECAKTLTKWSRNDLGFYAKKIKEKRKLL